MKGDQPLFFDVLQDKNFRDLLRESQRRAIPWEEFLEHPLPLGLSPNQTNKVLESLGRCLGVHLFEGTHGDLLWYRRTYELNELVTSIESLNASIKAFLTKNPHAFTPAYLNKLLHKEVNAALEYAEFYYSQPATKQSEPYYSERAIERSNPHYSERTSGQTKHDYSERTAMQAELRLTEKTAKQLLETFLTLHRSITATSHPLTRSTLEAFARQLADSLYSNARVETKCSSAQPSIPYFDTPQEKQLCYQHFLDELCAYGNSDNNHDDLPILKGILIGSAIMHQSAFGVITPFLASLTTHLQHTQMNETVLAYLPLLPAFLAWRKEEIGNFCVHSFSSYVLTSAQTPSDVTLFQTVNAQCILFTLKNLHERLTRHTERTATLTQNLDDLQNLNARQRKALVLLVDKNTEFITIQDYQRKYKISYATARRDLLALEQELLLESYYEGKALAFKVSTKLLELTNA